MELDKYFIPPFYLVDETKNVRYNTAMNRLELLSNFDSKPFRLLNDKEVLLLENKLLEAKL